MTGRDFKAVFAGSFWALAACLTTHWHPLGVFIFGIAVGLAHWVTGAKKGD